MNRERLRAFRANAREGWQIRGQLEELEARMYTPRAQRFSSTPRGSSGDGHTMDDLVALHIKLTDAYRQKLTDLAREQLEIENAIAALEPVQRMVIRYRYLDALSWEDVCARVHYGWAQTHRIHAAALLALETEEKGENER